MSDDLDHGADARDPAADARPAPSLLAGVVGQPAAVAAVAAAVHHPVHAYLLVGPEGTGAPALARALAAAFLCPDHGCGTCSTCRRVLHGTHPDLVEIERQGATLGADEARSVVVGAQRRPLEARHQVMVVPDVHLALGVVPVLLKTVEEPPPSTIVILTAETVPPALDTLASRCARIPLQVVPDQVVAAWLMGLGVADDLAEEAARASGGRPERARVLAGDPGLAARRALWASVPDQLDGSGGQATAVAGELMAATDAAVATLAARHQQQADDMAAQAQALGERAAAARKALEDRQRREQRRWRTDELRAGLGVLAGVYRDRVVTAVAAGEGGTSSARRALSSMVLVEEAAHALVRNPNEALLLQALALRIGRLP